MFYLAEVTAFADEAGTPATAASLPDPPYEPVLGATPAD